MSVPAAVLFGIVIAIAAIGFMEAALRPIPRAHMAGFALVILAALAIDGSRHAIFYAVLSARAAALDALRG